MSRRSSLSPSECRPTSRVLASAAFAVLLIAGSSLPVSATDVLATTVSSTAFSEEHSADDLAAAIDTRRRLGFDGDPAYVAQLQGGGADVGTDAIGLPLTAAELAEVLRREEVLGLFFESLEAQVRARSDFGGVYVDQLEGGVVVVLTTGDADALAAELHEAEPRLAEDLRVRHVDATAAQLEEAAARLFGERDEWSGGIPVFEAGVDYERTQVVIAVPSDQVQTAAAVAGTALADVLDSIDAQDTGITIRVKEGRQPAPTVCTSRSNCYNPLRPGVKITSNSLCTLGFHIIFNGSARNTLTAGHCSGTVWYHYSFGLVGVQSANLLCAGGAPYSDIKRMTIDPSQQTTAVYGQTASEAVFVNASTWPVQNATARMSLGNTNALRTGIVVAALPYYTLIGTPCDILGGAYNITSIGGDSGSPSWHPSPNRAIGINSSEDGHFGLVQRALGVWNAKVYG